ncbi:cytoskeletal protein binding protein [Allomyces javanicus]|nr:cytoskeletal protein binding protein [Allomyces javanicus]
MAPILRVVRAAYDYDAQHDDELQVHEGQLLHVIGEPEPDWLLCSVKGSDGQTDLTGNVPENYVEPALVLYHAVALYDYDATNDDELTVRENDALDVFEVLPDDWVVAQCGPAFGLVPANYVEERGDAAPASAGPEPVVAAPALPAPPPAEKPAGPPKIATALYDYDPVEPDDLDIYEGENCLVIDDADPDWCKVRIISSKKDRSNKEGFVPRGYLQFKEVGKSPAAAATASPPAPVAAAPALPAKPIIPAAAPVPPPLATKPVVAAAAPAVPALDALAAALAAQAREKENVDRIRREREAEEERVRRAQEEFVARRASEEAEQQARAERERRERLERDRQERERQQREEDERRAAAAAVAASTPPALPARPPLPRRPSSPARPTAAPVAANSTGSDSIGSGAKDMPDPGKVRIWLDTSGQHRTEAAFIDFVDGKVKLHKTNGARIDVPIAALCSDDQVLACKLKGIPPPASLVPVAVAPTPKPSSVGTPLATGGSSTMYGGFDWLPFLTSCGVDPQDAHTYAVHFAAEKLDESFLPELTRDILKGLGVKEGDILRIQKRLTTNKTQVQQREADLTTQNLARIEQYFQERVKLSDQSASQLKSDEDLARRLQQEELARANAVRGKSAATSSAVPMASVSSTTRPVDAPRRASVSTSSAAPPVARMPRSTSGLPVQSAGVRPLTQDRTNPASVPGAVPVIPSTVRPMAAPVAAPMPVMQPNRSLPAPLIPTQGTRPGFIPTKMTTPTPVAGAGVGPAAGANGVTNPILGPASLGAMNMGMSQIPAGMTQEQMITLQRQQQQMMAMAAAGGGAVPGMVGAQPGMAMGQMAGMMASASGGMQPQGLAGAVSVNQTGRAANWQHATPDNPFGTPLAAAAGAQPRPGTMPMAHSVSQGANLAVMAGMQGGMPGIAGMGTGGVPNAGLGYPYPAGQPGPSYMGMPLTQAQMAAMQQQQQQQQQQRQQYQQQQASAPAVIPPAAPIRTTGISIRTTTVTMNKPATIIFLLFSVVGVAFMVATSVAHAQVMTSAPAADTTLSPDLIAFADPDYPSMTVTRAADGSIQLIHRGVVLPNRPDTYGFDMKPMFKLPDDIQSITITATFSAWTKAPKTKLSSAVERPIYTTSSRVIELTDGVAQYDGTVPVSAVNQYSFKPMLKITHDRTFTRTCTEESVVRVKDFKVIFHKPPPPAKPQVPIMMGSLSDGHVYESFDDEYDEDYSVSEEAAFGDVWGDACDGGDWVSVADEAFGDTWDEAYDD